MFSDFGICGVKRVRSSRIFTIDFTQCTSALARRVANELLTDPVAETCQLHSPNDSIPEPDDSLAIEVHLRPGVMDNVAHSTILALRDMNIAATSVRTAWRYDLYPIPSDTELRRIPRLLGNDCIEEVIVGTKPIRPPPPAPRYKFELRQVALRELDEPRLEKLSRDGHLFLSLDEMLAIRNHYRAQGRDPTDLELETLAQTWSEHCVHKTLRAAVRYRGAPMPGRPADQTVELRYDNLLKDTIVRATQELMTEGRGPTCLSVFKDNAGIIAFDETLAVAFKVETHNHPSAIEPYGGAATGVGGVIRDILGCGLGAKPIANTDVFCVAPPDWPIDAVPRGVIHPKTILKGITRGVRDYGNCMGIPTVNGAIYFDERYLGNPLVYCGCVGIIPRDRIEKRVQPGDAIVLMGGKTGRDGIHGATFSSAELTDTHEDEFAHAVQIGNPIEEKKVLDVILQARDFGEKRRCLFSAITDCGAGGLSSAIGEMAAECGAEVDLEKVPLKYEGLRYDEIWISEAQERMVLSVPQENVQTLLDLAASEDVEATIVGRFTDGGRLIIRYQGTQVGELDCSFLHDGLPRRTLEAEWRPTDAGSGRKPTQQDSLSIADRLRHELSRPTVASKHWLIRQYDHEVQARSVIKPLAGPREGPSDAAVVLPKLDSHRGIAIGCGLAPQVGDADPYWMAVAAIDEALRNVVCVGGDPAKTAILDNFCWPRVDDARNMGALVRACQGCYDAAKAYGLPFISGKDSLNNEFSLDAADVERIRKALDEAGASIRDGRIAIPCTLLISAVSLIEDVRRCVTMDLKHDGSQLYLIGQPTTWQPAPRSGRPGFDFAAALRTHQTVAKLIREGLVTAVHDVSDGGIPTAVTEMCIAANRPCVVHPGCDWDESPALYLVEVDADKSGEFRERSAGTPVRLLASVSGQGTENSDAILFESKTGGEPERLSLSELRSAWRLPLDW